MNIRREREEEGIKGRDGGQQEMERKGDRKKRSKISHQRKQKEMKVERKEEITILSILKQIKGTPRFKQQ